VLAIERIKLAEPEPVYNFTVKGPHTYFVLEVGVLVHNSGSCKWNAEAHRWYDPVGTPENNFKDRGQFVSFDEAPHRASVDPTPGRVVDVDEAAELSGIPKEYLEKMPEIAAETNTICGLRTCNPLLEDLRTKTWPKDTYAEVFHSTTGEKLKVSSAVIPKFKTTEFGLVGTTLEIDGSLIEYGIVRRPDGTFGLVEMAEIVDTKGNIILDPTFGIPMGPDVDTYFFLKPGEEGWVNLGTEGPEEEMRKLIGNAMTDSRPGIGPRSAVGHGPAQPYFGTVKGWGDGLVVMPDGQFIWLQEHEIEQFFHHYGLTSQKVQINK
jgi:hypothetical protein